MIDYSSTVTAATSPSAATSISGINSSSSSNSQSSTTASSIFRQSSTSLTGQSPGSSGSISSSATNLLMHNAFGNIGSGHIGGGGISGPPTLDLNEFPSLTGQAVSINTFSQQSSAIGRPAYVGIMKDNVTNQSGSNEFNIQSEDFPALPGASPGGTATSAAAVAAAFNQFQQQQQQQQNLDGNNSGGQQQQQDHQHLQHHHHQENNRSVTTPPTLVGTTQQTAAAVAAMSASSLTSSLFSSLSSHQSTNSANNNNNGAKTSSSNSQIPAINVSKDGMVTNIPPGMLTDQYGIAGLMAMLHQANSNPNLFALTIGYDVTALNMNLGTKDRLYHTFPGPWNDKPLKPHEIDYSVPPEYLIFNSIRDKLAQIKLTSYCEDLLFYLFYCLSGEHMQAEVGAELYSREWRFHKDEGIWITRKQGSQPLEQSSNFERGSYIYFDLNTWSKNQKEMLIEYDRLDGPSNQ
ncbi:CCR4-NOT transcription complex subunit 2 [Dermatophagoides farinae]|uniref:CCR4-NOT transcription complex subunit 2 n=1 Tax=Dermatophagoides farinae TaxID=6954 RepID=A0A922HP12_DERFA|nr:CCR4-NOT transcription complex subunit 2-like [Dermatophagoides farinae]KAH7643795.1 ccr4-not transcription complex subunit 2-like protein [Dermatophagoides farinae]KAH9497200.1 CCR4-NOT transcription complex subunit 2 [Dermatophagoides farinae]